MAISLPVVGFLHRRSLKAICKHGNVKLGLCQINRNGTGILNPKGHKPQNFGASSFEGQRRARYLQRRIGQGSVRFTPVACQGPPRSRLQTDGNSAGRRKANLEQLWVDLLGSRYRSRGPNGQASSHAGVPGADTVFLVRLFLMPATGVSRQSVR